MFDEDNRITVDPNEDRQRNKLIVLLLFCSLVSLCLILGAAVYIIGIWLK